MSWFKFYPVSNSLYLANMLTLTTILLIYSYTILGPVSTQNMWGQEISVQFYYCYLIVAIEKLGNSFLCSPLLQYILLLTMKLCIIIISYHFL